MEDKYEFGNWLSIIIALSGIVYTLYISHASLSNMEYKQGVVKTVKHTHFKIKDFKETFYIKPLEILSRNDDSIMNTVKRGDTAEIWYYKGWDPGNFHTPTLFDEGGPYIYYVTQLKINGKIKIGFSNDGLLITVLWIVIYMIWLGGSIYMFVRRHREEKDIRSETKLHGRDTIKEQEDVFEQQNWTSKDFSRRAVMIPSRKSQTVKNTILTPFILGLLIFVITFLAIVFKQGKKSVIYDPVPKNNTNKEIIDSVSNDTCGEIHECHLIKQAAL